MLTKAKKTELELKRIEESIENLVGFLEAEYLSPDGLSQDAIKWVRKQMLKESKRKVKILITDMLQKLTEGKK